MTVLFIKGSEICCSVAAAGIVCFKGVLVALEDFAGSVRYVEVTLASHSCCTGTPC